MFIPATYANKLGHLLFKEPIGDPQCIMGHTGGRGGKVYKLNFKNINIRLIGELASPIVSIGDPKSIVLTNQRTPIQKASPNLEREPQFGHANSHSRVRGCGCALSCNLIGFCLLYLAIPVCIVIMYAFPQGYPSNLSLTFNLELYTSICEAD